MKIILFPVSVTLLHVKIIFFPVSVTLLHMKIIQNFINSLNRGRRHTVTQLVETMHYKLEGGGFDS
jgi:hypothetical protein